MSLRNCTCWLLMARSRGHTAGGTDRYQKVTELLGDLPACLAHHWNAWKIHKILPHLNTCCLLNFLQALPSSFAVSSLTLTIGTTLRTSSHKGESCLAPSHGRAHGLAQQNFWTESLRMLRASWLSPHSLPGFFRSPLPLASPTLTLH